MVSYDALGPLILVVCIIIYGTLTPIGETPEVGLTNKVRVSYADRYTIPIRVPFVSLVRLLKQVFFLRRALLHVQGFYRNQERFSF